jgi:cytochrome c553
MTDFTSKSPKPAGKKIWLYNLLFVVVCAGLFLFLWTAPEETTSRLPNDEIHARFQTMEKKEAEKACEACHNPEGEAPLSKDHPPKYRCLFCHKKVT